MPSVRNWKAPATSGEATDARNMTRSLAGQLSLRFFSLAMFTSFPQA